VGERLLGGWCHSTVNEPLKRGAELRFHIFCHLHEAERNRLHQMLPVVVLSLPPKFRLECLGLPPQQGVRGTDLFACALGGLLHVSPDRAAQGVEINDHVQCVSWPHSVSDLGVEQGADRRIASLAIMLVHNGVPEWNFSYASSFLLQTCFQR